MGNMGKRGAAKKNGFGLGTQSSVVYEAGKGLVGDSPIPSEFTELVGGATWTVMHDMNHTRSDRTKRGIRYATACNNLSLASLYNSKIRFPHVKAPTGQLVGAKGGVEDFALYAYFAQDGEPF